MRGEPNIIIEFEEINPYTIAVKFKMLEGVVETTFFSLKLSKSTLHSIEMFASCENDFQKIKDGWMIYKNNPIKNFNYLKNKFVDITPISISYELVKSFTHRANFTVGCYILELFLKEMRKGVKIKRLI